MKENATMMENGQMRDRRRKDEGQKGERRGTEEGKMRDRRRKDEGQKTERRGTEEGKMRDRRGKDAGKIKENANMIENGRMRGRKGKDAGQKRAGWLAPAWRVEFAPESIILPVLGLALMLAGLPVGWPLPGRWNLLQNQLFYLF